MWDFIKQKATEFFRGAPGVDPNTPGRIWLKEMKEALPYLTPDLVGEATKGSMKGFAQGVVKGITLNNVELESLKPKTDIEEQAAKIPQMIGELESWLIPFGIAEKGVALAIKGATKVPMLTRMLAKIPVFPRVAKAALPFATISAFYKTEEERTTEEKFAEGALWGLGFGVIGGLVPIPGPLKNAANKALKKLIKQPKNIIIKNLPIAEKKILSRFGIMGEQIDKEIYERAMRASVKLNKIPPVKPPIKPPVAEIPKYPEEPYKRKLLKEIGEMKELPKMEQDVIGWTPPTWGYKNAFTQKMYGAWNTINKWWIEKTPSWAKTFRNRKLEELTLERQRVVDGLTMKYTEEFIRPLHKLTPLEKSNIGRMVFKHIPIEAKYAPTIKNIDLHIGQLGKAIVDIDKKLLAEGVLKKEYALLSEDTWFKHLGNYMRTVYVRPPKVLGRVPQITPRRVFTADGVLNRSAFRKKLTDAEWGANNLLFEGKTLKEIKTYSMKELEGLGKSAKTAWGWTTEADYVLARTFYDMSNVYATRLWQESVLRSPELFSRIPKAGFVSTQRFLPKGVTKDIRLGMLNDGFINPALENEIRLFTSSARPTMAIFGEPLSWWKAFKVAGNPATVARNYISGGFIQTDMAGYPVWGLNNSPEYIKGVKSYATKDTFYKKLRDAGAYGADYHRIEIEPGIMRSIEKSLEKVRNPYQEYGARLAEGMGSKLKTVKGAFAYYGHIDHIQRTYLIRCAMRDGASLPQAIHFANKWELNYRFTPEIINNLRTGLPGFAFPFISFYSLMAPRIAEVAITRPWVLAKYPILVGMANEYSKSVLGLTSEQVEAGKPDFLKDQPYVMVLPYKDQQGNPVYLNMAYTLPFGSWETGFLDWQALLDLGKGAGMAGIMHAILTNYDSFTERKIYDEGDLPSEKKEKVAMYALRSLGPGVIQHVINLWKASQGESIGFPYPERRDFTQTTLRALGVSTYSGGYNDAFWKIKMLENEIQSIRYSLANLEKNPNVSHEEKVEKREETLEYIRRKQEEINKIRTAMPPVPTSYYPEQTIPKMTPEQREVLLTFPH